MFEGSSYQVREGGPDYFRRGSKGWVNFLILQHGQKRGGGKPRPVLNKTFTMLPGHMGE